MSDFEARARKAADAVRRQIDELPAHHDEGIRRAQRSPARFAIPTAVAAAVLIGAVAIGIPRIGGGITSGAEGAASGGAGAAFALTGALKPFPTCDTVLQYFKDQAPEYLLERAGERPGHGRRAGAPRIGNRAARPGTSTQPRRAPSRAGVRRSTRRRTSKRPASTSRTSSRRTATASSRSPGLECT